MYIVLFVESICIFQPLSGNEISSKSLTKFQQFEQITITCPQGMALASNIKTRICGANSEWNEPLPTCIKVNIL